MSEGGRRCTHERFGLVVLRERVGRVFDVPTKAAGGEEMEEAVGGGEEGEE